jgi:hypothetical protein
MKVRAMSYRTIWLGALVYGVPFAFGAAIVEMAVHGRLRLALYILLGLAWVVLVAASLRIPNRIWVVVDGGIVTWRVPSKPGAAAATTPSGRVAVTDIGAVAVAVQDRAVGRKMLRGHLVLLTLLDGTRVTLPIWTPATAVSTQFSALLDTVRTACPPDMPWDTTAIGGPASAVVT